MRKRLLSLFGLVAAVCAFAPGRVDAGPMLLADLETGHVLESEEATRIWHPASITKLMTVHVALTEIRAGRLTMDTRLVASPEAVRIRPSKIGIKPGESLTLRDALRLLMVKSANDVAIMVAEHVGGSVEGFADMMNRQAAALGMRESRFVNPHGFAAEGHRSSARDMAVLARRLLLDFPEHRDLFAIGALKLDDTVMENTNGIIGRYAGATGMKTGFVCASGFNVVATARRDGRELVVVVLGSPSAAERTLRTMALFDAGFARRSRGPTLDSLTSPGAADPPDMREAICGARAASMGENSDPAQPVAAATAAASPDGAASTPVPATAAAGATQRPRLGPRESFVPLPVTIHRPPAEVARAPTPGPRPATGTTAAATTATATKTASAATARPDAAVRPQPAPKAEPETKPEPGRRARSAPQPGDASENPPPPAERARTPQPETPRAAAPPKPAAKPAAATTPERAEAPKPSAAPPANAPPRTTAPPRTNASPGAVATPARPGPGDKAAETEAAPSGGVLNLPPRNPALSDRSR